MLPLNQTNVSYYLRQGWKKIESWLGHAWSICTKPFTHLIGRIHQVGHQQFFKPETKKSSSSLPNTTFPLPPSSVASSKQNKTEEEWLIDEYFFQEQEESKTKALKIINPEIPSTSIQQKPKLGLSSLSAKAPPLTKERKNKTKPPSPLISELRQWRQRKNNHPLSAPHLQSSPSRSMVFSSLIKPINKVDPIVIEAGGGGDCQLLSFLKGLEIQHPHLAKIGKNQKLVNLTANELRQIGIEFICEQITKEGRYAEAIWGYLDSDRQEYNDAQIDNLEQAWLLEKEQLEQKLENRTITLPNYAIKKKFIRDKYHRLITSLENGGIIKTNEEFLQHLQKPGFFCSSLHLFALSAKFRLPIHVHDEKGVVNHNIQVFNPTESLEKPIHLYRTRNCHYQLLLFPSSTEKK